MSKAVIHCILACFAVLSAISGCSQQRVLFRHKPVVWEMNDNAPIDCPETNDYNRFAYTIDVYLNRQLDDLIDPVDPPPAMNVNSLDEVPNSSWFTNRMGVQRLTRQQVENGPGGEQKSPQRNVPWRVDEIRESSGNRCLTITDSEGQRFALWFDTPDSYEAGTASEVIASRIMYAAGYNVPESYIVYFIENDLAADTLGSLETGTVSADSLSEFLSGLVRTEDGYIRAVAVREFDGVDCGVFPMTGLRSDDANDLIPHEHRRELRALKVFNAWLGHVEVTPDNGIDVYEDYDGGSHLTHYIRDFRDCFGTYFLDNPFSHPGFQYRALDIEETLAGIFDLGLRSDGWERVGRQYDAFAGFYYESEHFDIDNWKPIHPVPYFSQLTPQDAFWAGKIIAVFGDDHLNGAIKEGAVPPPSEQYVLEVLKRRRIAILNWAFSNVNPLEEFELTFKRHGLVLDFMNLAEKYALVSGSDLEYHLKIMNQDYELLFERTTKSLHEYVLPHRKLDLSDDGNYLIIEIRTINTAALTVSPAARAHFVGGERTGFTLVGVERDS